MVKYTNDRQIIIKEREYTMKKLKDSSSLKQIQRFSIRKFSAGIASVVVGSFFASALISPAVNAQATTPASNTHSVAKQVTTQYQYLAIEELTWAQRQAIKSGTPSQIAQADQVYYFVYQAKRGARQLPVTGEGSTLLGLAAGATLIVFAVGLVRDKKKALTSLMLVTLAGQVALVPNSQAAQARLLEQFNQSFQTPVGQALPNPQVQIEGYEYVGYFAAQELAQVAPNASVDGAISESTESKASSAESSASQSSESKASSAESSASETSESKASSAESSASETSESKASSAESSASETSESKVSSAESSASETSESKASAEESNSSVTPAPEPPKTLDFKDLDAALQAANKQVANLEAVKLSDKTPKSVKAFEEELANAKKDLDTLISRAQELKDNPKNTEQVAINDLTKQVQNLADKTSKLSDNLIAQADKTPLQTVMTALAELVKEAKNVGLIDEVIKSQATLQNARSVVKDQDATEKDVAAMVKAVEALIEDLTYKLKAQQPAPTPSKTLDYKALDASLQAAQAQLANIEVTPKNDKTPSSVATFESELAKTKESLTALTNQAQVLKGKAGAAEQADIDALTQQVQELANNSENLASLLVAQVDKSALQAAMSSLIAKLNKARNLGLMDEVIKTQATLQNAQSVIQDSEATEKDVEAMTQSVETRSQGLQYILDNLESKEAQP
ncbi:YSIRK-type signal peptide-containing protein [uncultured Abiotrophia sp.]|uniref:YSIRK-type signal peptide-containing protein n=1 Tax=uncultured Abiotrophia sp. TaxID=316094 RepID=UPI00288AF530|nr:YSIRK-type signal peptide-containing protein [uncultured Abiotrophia sp.]